MARCKEHEVHPRESTRTCMVDGSRPLVVVGKRNQACDGSKLRHGREMAVSVEAGAGTKRGTRVHRNNAPSLFERVDPLDRASCLQLRESIAVHGHRMRKDCRHAGQAFGHIHGLYKTTRVAPHENPCTWIKVHAAIVREHALAAQLAKARHEL